MDSNLESLEKQVADLNRRFQTLENLIDMLQRSQQPPINAWPPRVFNHSQPLGGCPFCGSNSCLAGQCRTHGRTHETQLK